MSFDNDDDDDALCPLECGRNDFIIGLEAAPPADVDCDDEFLSVSGTFMLLVLLLTVDLGGGGGGGAHGLLPYAFDSLHPIVIVHVSSA